MQRTAFKTLGYLFTLLALAGIALPVLPTTPFALVALACFSRSDPKMRAWLWNHRWMGPYIQDWQQLRAIRRPAKWRASLVIVASWLSTLYFAELPQWGELALTITLAGVIVFIITRKEPVAQLKRQHLTDENNNEPRATRDM